MDYSELDLPKLLEYEKECISFLKWSRSLCTVQGGWIMWDGDKEDEAEEELRKIRAAIKQKHK